MSSDLLRKAASLMRERAEEAAATEAWDWRATDGSGYWAETTRAGRYIQAMTPAVAFGVADLLDNEASLIDGATDRPDLHLPLNGARIDRLVAIARAFLGESA